MTAARMLVRPMPLFAGWFAVTHALGWLFLWRAAVTLTRTWQDQPHQQVREPEPAEDSAEPQRVFMNGVGRARPSSPSATLQGAAATKPSPPLSTGFMNTCSPGALPG